ncbi:MAG TPA: signal peptidase I [Candidatus Saccharimonadales bacterium]
MIEQYEQPSWPSSQPQPTIQDVTPPTEPPKANMWQQLKPVLSVILFVVSVVMAATLINAFVFQSYYVEGTSMTPTLQDHDRLIIDKFSRTTSAIQGKTYVPERGQIIILDSTFRDRQGKPEQLIKRVIGLPGERISIQNGIITIYNHVSPAGFNIDESLNLSLAPAFSSEPIDIVLAKNEIYVVGDNRAPGGSLDSRSFGPVSLDNVEGRLWARIFPFNEMRIF